MTITSVVAGLLLLAALIVMNGLFVAAEYALVSLRKSRIEEMVKRGRPAPRPSSSSKAISTAVSPDLNWASVSPVWRLVGSAAMQSLGYSSCFSAPCRASASSHPALLP